MYASRKGVIELVRFRHAIVGAAFAALTVLAVAAEVITRPLVYAGEYLFNLGFEALSYIPTFFTAETREVSDVEFAVDGDAGTLCRDDLFGYRARAPPALAA